MIANDIIPDSAAAPDTIRQGERYLESLRRALLNFPPLTSDATDSREAAIRSELQDAQAAADHTLRERIEIARQTRDAALTVPEQEWEQLRGAIEERFEANAGSLDRNLQVARARYTSEFNEVVSEARREREEAVLLANTIASATIEGFLRDLRRKERALHEIENQRVLLEERAAELCARFRAAAPKAAPVESGELPESAFDLIEASGRAVSALGVLRLPNLMCGAKPFVLGGVIVVAVAGLFAALPVMGFQIGPPAMLAGIAGGVSLVILLLVGRSLAAAARKQVHAAAATAAGLLGAVPAAVERGLGAAQARFKKAETEVTQQRELEVQQADERLNGITSQAGQKRDGSNARLDEEFEAKKALFARERDERLAEGNRKRAKKCRVAEEAFAQASRTAQTKRDNEIAGARTLQAAAQERLERGWDEGVAALRTLVDEAGRLQLPKFDWHAGDGDASWEPVRDFVANVPFGRLELDLNRLSHGVREREDCPQSSNGPLLLPATLALPTRGSLLIESGREGRQAAIELLRAVMVRILTMLPPGQAHFTILDPIGLGENFAGLMHLVDYGDGLLGGRIWTEREHIEGRLTDLTAHMETVIQKYLRNEFDTIAAYNAQAGELAEPYRFLVVADYPSGFSETAMERLSSVVRSGARCGVFTLVACDAKRIGGDAGQWDDLREGSIYLEHTADGFRFADPAMRNFPLVVERPPTEARLTEIMHAVGREARNNLRVEVPFESIAPKIEEYWSASAAAEVRVPIGRCGAMRLQHFLLGSGLSQHALLAGKTGSGKSTLMHVLITNLALWYSPSEIEFYLIDFKKGVEFKAYATHGLPHARAIAIESDREFGLSVLQRVDAEMQRRGELFRAAGVQEIAGYREATGAELPRTLLIIDEFQVFFGEDDRLAQDAGVLLDRLVRQGRAFGVHVLLGSQTLAGNIALTRSTLGQMAVRIALQCSEADAQLIMDDSNTAARLLTRPGEAIYNDAGGLVDGNSPFQTAWLSDEQRGKRLAQIAEMARSRRAGAGAPVVFEGNAPADVRGNALLAAALRGEAYDEPLRAWLGEPVAIKDPTSVVFRRQPGAHLLIVGQQERASMAVMSAAVVSLAAQRSIGEISFTVLDGSPDDRQAESGLAQTAEVLPHKIELVTYRDVADQIRALADTVRQRLDGSSSNTTTIMLVIYGLQRYRALRRGDDDFSFSASDDSQPARPDKELALILREGSTVGVHALVWCDTLTNLERTFERGTIREFDHRLLFQMSASDSSHLTDAPEANRLGMHRALLFSEERGVMEKLRPYDAIDPGWLKSAGGTMRARAT